MFLESFKEDWKLFWLSFKDGSREFQGNTKEGQNVFQKVFKISKEVSGVFREYFNEMEKELSRSF